MKVDKEIASMERKVRLIMLLKAAENAGLYPLPVQQLHTLAYLANVLAPVWNMPAMDGKILKKQGGPFYPELQRDLDQLVGTGVIIITNLSHVLDENQRWRLEGSYRFNHSIADKIIASIMTFKAEENIARFIQELAYALSALSDEDIDNSVSEDAAYADSNVAFGTVVDFAEWRKINYSVNAARRFENLVPGDSRVTQGELLHLYVRHLYARLHDTN